MEPKTKAKSQTSFEILPMERRALEGIAAQEREIRLLHVLPIQKELQQTVREILTRMGLPETALTDGSYQLNTSTWTIERTPETVNGEAQADHSI